MPAVLFSLAVSLGIPIVALVYSFYQRRWIPYVLGVLAFIVSQVLLRLPLLEYLAANSAEYTMLRITNPILYSTMIGLSAGIFEELARYLAMRFLMAQRDWKSGLLFGAGHGGVEAVIFVGAPLVSVLLSSPPTLDFSYAIGGVERLFALMLHIGLSILVLQGVVQRRLFLVILAIFIHAGVDALVGIVPLFVSPYHSLLIVEGVLAISSITLFIYCILMKKKGVLE